MMGHYVVMGVSGCGKSLIGQSFANAIGARFIDGDDLHPAANIEKMRQGDALTDTDRAPWLDMVGQAVAQPGTVIACSALKRVYRDRIRAQAGQNVMFVYLHGGRDTLLKRLMNRPGHFMPVALLDSQLSTLEPPTKDESFIPVSIEAPPNEMLLDLMAQLKSPL